MSIYDQLNVKTLINAADSYTIIGGSRMPAEVMAAMSEAGKFFVGIEELHDRVGERIALLTRNEAAMVTNGAAAGLAITAAACLAGINAEQAQSLPIVGHKRREIIIHKSQRNGFENAIVQAGAELIEIGQANGTSEADLENAISERTAAIVYFAGIRYEKGAVPLDRVIAIADKHRVPVIVDAAAQLPPIDNLWAYTQAGAAMVIFSGGKTLRGPQSSGFIVGQKAWIAACRMNGSPHVSIGRPMKVGKEEMVGLLAAVERYAGLDHEAEKERNEMAVATICQRLNSLGYAAAREYPGPTGQDYAIVKVAMGTTGKQAEDVQAWLKSADPAIWVGISEDGASLLVNPLHLQEDEIEMVLAQFEALTKR
ncbi:aminotransferase class V-fold PLP-dependent enzyme [Cohnella silvisoli]|uniref:DegT/DnrJ/EryC1/StrS family aminotransferase n=1 Tax=Cohnella silvisoli TaxID=2873699 RepID=A0ABV1KRT1_9BACL|nr:DegT/DnrJ/EryC1/StrS family aminotransferase [Cohnella silvisoli]MCD9021652.1 DegT/DnrJ/EryC1/StrS family aminotransferase [Cohnella silvisoli]